MLTLYYNQIEQGVELVRRYDEPGSLLARHDELSQVWTNLVHNALQAMRHRGTLELAISGDANYLRVHVIDSGPGIPEAIRECIFQPFFTTKDQGEGSGLGLSICSEIVKRHDGSIDVTSRPGRTEFVVRLPRHAAGVAQAPAAKGVS